jgi:hypothetical protein
MTNKAQRPCTLWGKTFDSNEVEQVNAVSDHVYIVLSNKIIDSYYYDDKSIITGMLLEAIQAIASAQRSWLKAEGFEFVQDVVYMLLKKDGSFTIGTPYLDTDEPIFLLCDSKRNTFDCHIEFESVLAFKPISDLQETWDAVAGVEVYKGVV